MQGISRDITAPPPTATVHTLGRESELRLEVSLRGTAYLSLKSGTAEVFGVEIAPERTILLSSSRKLAVFSWSGAEVFVWGDVATYVSSESQVPLYANLHQQLEIRRDAAGRTGGNGPRILIAGPTDSGKSSLCRVLLSYACRVGRLPTFVDLDVGQGEVSIPGTVAATPLEKCCLSVEEGFSNTSPLAYFVGDVSPGVTPAVYRNSVERLADLVNKRMGHPGEVGISARTAGLVINTVGWVDSLGYDILLHSIKTLGADIVVVMGHDKTFAQLNEDLKNGAGTVGGEGIFPIQLIKLTRPGGAVERARDFRRDARSLRMKQYFYGPNPTAALTPESITVSFDNIVVVKVGGPQSDSAMLPIGKASALDPLRVTVVPVSERLVNQILAVSFAATDKQVPHVNCAGFVHVKSVDLAAKKIVLLSPCAGTLPGKYLVLGGLSWVDT